MVRWFPQMRKADYSKHDYERYKPQYKIVYSEAGNREFIPVGQVNVYDQIQSYKDSTSIEFIMKKAVNDPSVLRQRAGVYVDTRIMPQNMADAHKVITDAKQVYEKQLAEGKTKAPDFSTFLRDFRTSTGLANFVAQNTQKHSTTGVNTPVDAPKTDSKEVSA